MTGNKANDESMNQLKGKQFPDGAFTIFREEDLPVWQKNVSEAFPVIGGRFRLFAYSWLGDCFAVSEDQRTLGKVLIFDIGSGKILSTDVGFVDFVNTELTQHAAACLLISFFRAFLENGGRPPKYGECVGCIVPLFLGGKYDIENLEISDMDVYWTIMSQIKNKIEG